jgi:type II secretory ATPase GspE/PulE/Tfp pilus assembly ATPase PilB-like protein
MSVLRILKLLLLVLPVVVVSEAGVLFLENRGVPQWEIAAGTCLLGALAFIAMLRRARRSFATLAQDPVERWREEAILRDPAFIAEDTRAVRYADKLMTEAFFQSFERARFDPPVAGTSTVLFQLDGIWHHFDTISADLYGEVLTRFKMLGELDVIRRPHNQVGRTKVAVNGQPLAVRIEINLTPAGEQEMVLVFHREDLA